MKGPVGAAPYGPAVLIVSNGNDGTPPATVMAEIEGVLRSAGLPFRFEVVGDPADAGVLSRELLRRGERFIVAVGGDDVVHHVATGLFTEGRPADPDAVLGVIPMGAPADFARTFGLPENPARAAAHLTGENLYPIDAGLATCAIQGGGRAARPFVNVAQAGLGAAAVARAASLPVVLGRARRLLGFWAALASSRPTEVLLTGDRRSWEGKIHNIVIANGQYYGDGVKISPRSWPGDGYLDVLVMKGPRSDAFTILPRAFRGEHLPHPNIVEYRCRTLRVEAEVPLRIEADGQVLGTTPATFEVVPQSIRLKI
jgi:diacylglycerol kinase (ATP)